MMTRFYNPNLKRFINADIIDGSIEDSTSLNLYTYVNGNPISFVDPFGMVKERGQNGNASNRHSDWCGAAYLERVSVTTMEEEIDITLGLNIIRLSHTQTVTTTKTHGTEGEWLGVYAYSDMSVNGYDKSVGVGLDILSIIGYELNLELIGRGETISINLPDYSVYVNVAFNLRDDVTVSVGAVKKLDNGDEVNDQYSIKGNTMIIASVVGFAGVLGQGAGNLGRVPPQNYYPQPQS